MASFADFARDLGAAVVIYEHHKEKILDHIGKMVEEEAKDVIGTYRYGWPQLAESTQKWRESQGYTPNDPLLWSGAATTAAERGHARSMGLRIGGHWKSEGEGALIRDTISHEVVSHESAVDIGSESKIAAYQELGTSRIPPRSFLRMAAEAKEPEIVEHIGGRVHIAMLQGLKLIP